MGYERKRDANCLGVAVVIIISLLCVGFVEAATSLPKPVTLVWHYYRVHNRCDDAEAYVRHQVELAWKPKTGKPIVAKLLRLLYSDCFVGGCDASILLDGVKSEKRATQNRGLGGFKLIDKIKTVLESRCPGVVSCADIIHLATRDAVHLAGGPSYPVFTGRRDGMTSTASSVNLPSPSISLVKLTNYFKSKGLDLLDMTTLLGAHTMGRTRCRNIEDRLYNFNGTKKPDPTMVTSLLKKLKKDCPKRVKNDQRDPLVFLNQESEEYKFSESLYKNVLNRRAVLGTDQQLLYGSDTKEIIKEFANNFEDFRKSFALSISRVGSINVLTGNKGEIRQNCHFTNKDNPSL